MSNSQKQIVECFFPITVALYAFPVMVGRGYWWDGIKVITRYFIAVPFFCVFLLATWYEELKRAYQRNKKERP